MTERDEKILQFLRCYEMTLGDNTYLRACSDNKEKRQAVVDNYRDKIVQESNQKYWNVDDSIEIIENDEKLPFEFKLHGTLKGEICSINQVMIDRFPEYAPSIYFFKCKFKAPFKIATSSVDLRHTPLDDLTSFTFNPKEKPYITCVASIKSLKGCPKTLDLLNIAGIEDRFLTSFEFFPEKVFKMQISFLNHVPLKVLNLFLCDVHTMEILGTTPVAILMKELRNTSYKDGSIYDLAGMLIEQGFDEQALL